MYHAIVRARIRSLWRRIASEGFAAAVEQAAPDVRFTFVGETPLSTDVTGREALRAWFARTEEALPGLVLTPIDVAAVGPPWNTRVFVRLEVSGDAGYRNVAAQWIRLRWGRMVEDWVLEDTLRLSQHLESSAGRTA